MSTEQPPRRPKGRPRIFREGEAQYIHVLLDEKSVDWASQQPGGISATIRRCLESMQRQTVERAEKPSRGDA